MTLDNPSRAYRLFCLMDHIITNTQDFFISFSDWDLIECMWRRLVWIVTDKNNLSSAPVSFIITLIVAGGRLARGLCLSGCDLFIEYKSWKPLVFNPHSDRGHISPDCMIARVSKHQLKWVYNPVNVLLVSFSCSLWNSDEFKWFAGTTHMWRD